MKIFNKQISESICTLYFRTTTLQNTIEKVQKQPKTSLKYFLPECYNREYCLEGNGGGLSRKIQKKYEKWGMG